jgi:hypothetical protein
MAKAIYLVVFIAAAVGSLVPDTSACIFKHRQASHSRNPVYFAPVSSSPTNPPRELNCAGLTTKVRILLIGDTLDASIGDGVKQELDVVKGVLTKTLAEQYRDAEKDFSVLTDTQVSAKKIIDFIGRWDVKPSEAIFCYVTCHGAYEPTLLGCDPSGGHYFSFENRKQGQLLQSTLLNALCLKGARLTVLFGDSCNTRGDFHAVFAFRELIVDETNYFTSTESLLLGHTGIVNLNSADQDHASKVNEFSTAFGQTLGSSPCDPTARKLPEWKPFLNALCDATFELSEHNHRPVIYKDEVQKTALPVPPSGKHKREVPEVKIVKDKDK